MKVNPLIYAHRGSSGHAPENTMAAFRMALEDGADGIELDVQLTADGKLVVIHDETLDRTTSGQGLVVQHTYSQLQQLHAGKLFPGFEHETVPLLSQVLELLQPTRLELNIELKNGIVLYDGLEEAVIRQVREYGMEHRVVFSSFNHYSVAQLARQAPDIEAAVLYSAGLYRPWGYAATVGARALHPYFYAIAPEIVLASRQAGVRVRPWTVNKEEDFRRMVRFGVDAIITNYPRHMRSLLE